MIKILVEPKFMHLKFTVASIIALIFSVGVLSSCVWKSPSLAHKMEIRQGNVISDKTIAQLRPGMTREEVEFLLGPPSISDTFHANRWDYLYSLEKNGRKREFTHLALYFDGNTLMRVEKEF